MASKGAYEKGTDGSDHAFRQRVDTAYVKGSQYKSKLMLFAVVHTLAVLLLLAFTVAVSTAHYPLHPFVFLALVLPVAAQKGIKTNNTALLTVYSGAGGVTAAYLAWFGIGRCLDYVNAMGLQLPQGLFLLLNATAIVALLIGSYYARKLIGLWREAAFAREMKRMTTK